MIPAIVLAAGRSSRMGRPKALLPLPGGESFLQRIVRTLDAGGVSRVLVVLDPGGPPIAAHLEELAANVRAAVSCVPNPDAARGQLSSLQCGLVSAGEGAPAVLVTLVDLPLVRVDSVRALLHAWRETGAPLVRPARDAKHGHPVILGRQLMDDLLAADPREDARPVVRRYAAQGVDLAMDDPGAFADVDTPEEYGRLVAGEAASTPKVD